MQVYCHVFKNGLGHRPLALQLWRNMLSIQSFWPLSSSGHGHPSVSTCTPLFLQRKDSVQLQISDRPYGEGRLLCQGTCESIAEGNQSFSQRALLKMSGMKALHQYSLGPSASVEVQCTMLLPFLLFFCIFVSVLSFQRCGRRVHAAPAPGKPWLPIAVYLEGNKTQYWLGSALVHSAVVQAAATRGNFPFIFWGDLLISAMIVWIATVKGINFVTYSVGKRVWNGWWMSALQMGVFLLVIKVAPWRCHVRSAWCYCIPCPCCSRAVPQKFTAQTRDVHCCCQGRRYYQWGLGGYQWQSAVDVLCLAPFKQRFLSPDRHRNMGSKMTHALFHCSGED